MAKFEKFEDIKAWQKAREITKTIYTITQSERFSKDYGLRDQVRRSAVSIMANIAEGNGRRTNKDFASFLTLAHGSAAETQSHLYVALDLEYINKQDFNEVYGLLQEVSKMTMALSKHLLESVK